MAAAIEERKAQSRTIDVLRSRWKSKMPHADGTDRARLRIVAAAATMMLLRATPASAADTTQRLAWHLAPSARYAADVHLTHIITNDLAGFYKKIVGSKADPVTILEDRSIRVASGANSSIDVAISDARRYGGDHPKDASVVTRTSQYAGTLAQDGKRNPSDEPLVDAGDGALSQLPDDPIQPGASWTFSRMILVDRDLGHGQMTYTDTLERIDVRGGHRIAVISVKGAGRVDVAPDLQAKGFQTTDMTQAGTGEFDLTSGTAAAQHYTAHAEWRTRVLWIHLGLIFDDTYDAQPWSIAVK